MSLIAIREKTHGDWHNQSDLSQALKSLVRNTISERGLIFSSSQKEAIEMICVKISRIANGDPNCLDHWEDIEGYARLGRGGRP